MSKFIADYAIDFRTLDFSKTNDYAHFVVAKNINYTYPTSLGSFVATDVAMFYNGTSVSNMTTGCALMGRGFIYNTANSATSGHLTGIALTFMNASGGENGLTTFGFDISLVSFQSAVASSSRADDTQLLHQMLAADDTLAGSAAQDYIFGWSGDDSIVGNSGADTLSGQNGRDTVIGGQGNDKLFGGAGHDTLDGGSGADMFAGGSGRDILDAGVDASHDVFIYKSISESSLLAADSLVHFVSGTDDIDLRLIDANTSRDGDQAFLFNGTKAAAHSLWIMKIGGDIYIRGDVNGDTMADFQINALYASKLVAGDFWL